MTIINESPEQSMEKIRFPVTGMNCMGCTSKVKSALSTIDSVSEVSVNLADSSAWVSFDTKQVDSVQLQQAVRSVGYDLII